MSITRQAPLRSARRIVAILLVVALTLPTLAQDPGRAVHKVKLQRGKVLTLSLLTPLDSGRSRVGDRFSLKLMRPLQAEGATVLPAGWVIQGEVTNVQHAGKNCHSGRVIWKPDVINTPGGEQVRVQLISSRLVARGGRQPDHAPLDNPAKKVGRALKYAAMAPVVILLSPVLILMLIGMSGEGGCNGELGPEEFDTPETTFVAAVSKNLRLTPLP